MKPRVAILDYGCGNLGSVANAVRKVGGEAATWRVGESLDTFSHLVMPGQGHFGEAARAIHAPIERPRIPVLGICLGMQLMCEGSEEAPGVEGLGWLPYRIERMPILRLPHVGWNTIEWWDTTREEYYFCHSYAAPGFICDDRGLHPKKDTAFVIVEGKGFLAAVKHGNLWAVQFHPEKSGKVGLAFLERFLAL